MQVTSEWWHHVHDTNISYLKLSVPNQTGCECTAASNQALFISVYVCMVYYSLPYITVIYGKQVMQDTDIYIRTSVSSTSSPCSSVNVTDQVSHPHKTRVSWYPYFWIASVKTKGFRLNGSRHCMSWICSSCLNEHILIHYVFQRI